ncbi:MAG: hypothetical protein RMI91_14045 [Gemmatales bacterium]|nr:hypothetical protein [Gemmatales bacterium]MDW7995767.1 hypothetical protein [Gemmatales bacterium]
MDETPRLAFLTVQPDGSAFIAALLITNHWGRPLEFHVTQPVQPSKLHQILYGSTLPTYLYCEVLAKALLEKALASPHLLIADFPESLNATCYSSTPVVYVAPEESREPAPNMHKVFEGESYAIYTNCNAPETVDFIQRILKQVRGLDLLEPFDRIRQAIRESRRLGVVSRAA